ncbi:hypothetical protein RIF29_04807 [Crotalaria pallida]|uniref:Uncharacterized protein n=1 Tax=Crotalaria pallida TaxID=3830 RepID=A0AAN9PA07_CROPI
MDLKDRVINRHGSKRRRVTVNDVDVENEISTPIFSNLSVVVEEIPINPNCSIPVRASNVEELLIDGGECQIRSNVGMPKVVFEDITNQYQGKGGKQNANAHSGGNDTVCAVASVNNFMNQYSVISQPTGRRFLYKSVNNIVCDLSHQFTKVTDAGIEHVKSKVQNAHAEQICNASGSKCSSASVNNFSRRYVVLEPLKGQRVLIAVCATRNKRITYVM